MDRFYRCDRGGCKQPVKEKEKTFLVTIAVDECKAGPEDEGRATHSEPQIQLEICPACMEQVRALIGRIVKGGRKRRKKTDIATGNGHEPKDQQ